MKVEFKEFIICIGLLIIGWMSGIATVFLLGEIMFGSD